MENPREITFGDSKYIREDAIIEAPQGEHAPFEIGKSYHVETVTKYFLGRLIDVTDTELVFTECAWIPDTGRYHEYMKGNYTSSFECEPYPADAIVIIGRGSLCSCVEHKIHLEVK